MYTERNSLFPLEINVHRNAVILGFVGRDGECAEYVANFITNWV